MEHSNSLDLLLHDLEALAVQGHQFDAEEAPATI